MKRLLPLIVVTSMALSGCIAVSVTGDATSNINSHNRAETTTETNEDAGGLLVVGFFVVGGIIGVAFALGRQNAYDDMYRQMGGK